MTRNPVIRALSVLAVLFMLAPAFAMAQDSPPPLAEMWVLTAKAGHGEEFRTAVKEHMAFRTEHGDPRAWQAYSPVLGDDLNRLAIRFCCIEWSDVDAYREWNMSAPEVGEHYDENVAPHVAGAVALLWSAQPTIKNQIDLTETYLNEQAIHLPTNSCDSNGWPNNLYGFGRLDVLASVQAALGTRIYIYLPILLK